MKVLHFAVLATFLTGCGVTYPTGSIYQATTTPSAIDKAEVAGTAKTGDKAGESCATGILALAAFGDASLDAAKKAGSITDIHSVEFRGMSILGIYTQGCTVVHGK
jgi:hypothetical protein